MTPAARVKYHRDFWPAACRGQRWDARDQAKRRAVCLDAMVKVGGPSVTTSDDAFGADETTALFCYLDHLAHPADFDRAARWTDCMTDYRAYNRARQADWHEEQTYGAGGSKKLARQRFGGARTAVGGPLDSFDPVAIRKRHLTTAKRPASKQRAERASAAAPLLPLDLPPARQELAGTASPF